jgi:putative endonuclease
VTARRQALGAAGEAQAAHWYEAQGYTVEARNWRCRQGELDLVLARGGLLVFCEVKTRTSDAFGAPVEAVTRTKQLRLRRLAAAWIDQAATRPREMRFDVASILAGRLDVIEDAF